jgi:PHP family Zn ribbon phosphoesterase
MDLLACSHCDRRFYAPGAGPSTDRCPQCGGGLGLALHRITSIPLDARWLEVPVTPTVTAMAQRKEIPSREIPSRWFA